MPCTTDMTGGSRRSRRAPSAWLICPRPNPGSNSVEDALRRMSRKPWTLSTALPTLDAAQKVNSKACRRQFVERQPGHFHLLPGSFLSDEKWFCPRPASHFLRFFREPHVKQSPGTVTAKRVAASNAQGREESGASGRWVSTSPLVVRKSSADEIRV